MVRHNRFFYTADGQGVNRARITFYEKRKANSQILQKPGVVGLYVTRRRCFERSR